MQKSIILNAFYILKLKGKIISFFSFLILTKRCVRSENLLADWLLKAETFENIKMAVVGQERAIHLITIAIFSRGHVLLEGDVGVGKQPY